MDVAWNQVKVSGLPREEKLRLLSEVEILKELDHKNIIKLYHSWIVTEKDEISVNFITEACAQTLKKYAAKLKTNLDLRAVKSWSRQILRGLDYLHSHDPPIVHRDLKCDNIFVNQNQGEVKIGDLGLAAALDNQRTKSVIGTPEFMAPELYDEDYDERVDIYSFGMCIIELVTHECPYSECSNPAQIYKRVTGGVKPEALDKIIDSDLRSFILKCISPIEKRLTAKELMNDPFLDKSLNKPKVVEKRTTVEEQPEAARPGGTQQFAVISDRPAGSAGDDAEDATKPRSARESHAEGEVRDVNHAPPAPGSVDGIGSDGGRDDGYATADDHAGGQGSRAASEKGEPTGGSRAGSERGGSETTSPTSAVGIGSSRPGSHAEGIEEAGGASDGVGGDGAGSAMPSPSGSRENLDAEAMDVMGAESHRPKSKLGQSSRSASRDDLASMAAAEEGKDRRKGGSLDFRVKGRILEDKTLRLRLKIGDASGHTRTVEFPFNTDTDSSYSVASEMVDELQLSQSDIRTIMNEIENEIKFLNEGRKKAETGSAPGSDAGDATGKRSSAPDISAGYTSGDASERGMTRSKSHAAAMSSPPRAASPVPARPRVSSPSTMAQPHSLQHQQQQQQQPPPTPHSQQQYPIAHLAPVDLAPPSPPVAAIEAAVEAAHAAMAPPAMDSSTRVAPPPVASASAPPSRSATPAPPPSGAYWPAPSHPPQTAQVPTMPTVTHLEQDMHHAHISTHHLQHGQAHLRSGAPSSKASSVMSEDLSAVEDDEAAEEREMEQLMAAQQKEAADMQRRHTQQMQEKREALRRQKLERKSMLGGAHGTGSASSMSSLDYSHSGSARPSMDGLANASSFAAPAAGSGRPPIAKPASHVQQGPPAPGLTPPGSPAAMGAQMGVAGHHGGFAAHQPAAMAHQPLLHHQQQTQQQPQQPHLAREQPPAQPAQAKPPQPPQSQYPSHVQQMLHPTPVQQLVSGEVHGMNQSGSVSSVVSHGSSGTASGDESAKPAHDEKEEKKKAAKEKLMMMEASALLNLDGFGGGKSKEGKAKPDGMGAGGSKKKKESEANAGGGMVSAGVNGGSSNALGGGGGGGPSAVLGAHAPSEGYCVKPVAYVGSVDAHNTVAYNGQVPPQTGVQAPATQQQQQVQQQHAPSSQAYDQSAFQPAPPQQQQQVPPQQQTQQQAYDQSAFQPAPPQQQ